MITLFTDFLKENDFYDAWIEGFNIVNECNGEELTFEQYCKSGIGMNHWLFVGLSLLSQSNIGYFLTKQNYPKLFNKITEWREKYLDKWAELDIKWMQQPIFYEHDIY